MKYGTERLHSQDSTDTHYNYKKLFSVSVTLQWKLKNSQFKKNIDNILNRQIPIKYLGGGNGFPRKLDQSTVTERFICSYELKSVIIHHIISEIFSSLPLLSLLITWAQFSVGCFYYKKTNIKQIPGSLPNLKLPIQLSGHFIIFTQPGTCHCNQFKLSFSTIKM